MPYELTRKVGEWLLLNNASSVQSATSVRLVDYPNLEWDLKGALHDCLVAPCEFAGPIAVVQHGTNVVEFYSSSGASIAEAVVGESSEPIKFICWNTSAEQEHLVVLLADGTISFINTKGEQVATSARIDGPTVSCPSGNGLVCVNEAGKVILLECQLTGEYRPRVVELPPSVQEIATLVAIPRTASDSGYVEVLLAPFDDMKESSTVLRAIFHTSKPVCEDLRLEIEGGTVVRMALSPSKTKLALLNTDGRVFVSSLDFTDLFEAVSTESDVPPHQLAWCGEKAIAYTFLSHQFDEDLGYETTVTVFDPTAPEEILTVATRNTTEVFMAVECDGIRLLSCDICQFLQHVPSYAQRMFSAGSKEPAALLTRAFDEFMQNNAGSVQLIRELTHKHSVAAGGGRGGLDDDDDDDDHGLVGAIDDCVATAGFEILPEMQKRLLRIANFGKSFCTRYDTTKFVNMTRRLRALNALRSPPVGMMLTVAEFGTLEGDRLAKRLVHQNQYRLAFEICSFLDMKPNLIMIDWALHKISESCESDQAIAHAVISKFKTCKNISYERIAMTAHARGRNELAIMLLSAEPSPKNQVPTLLDIHREDIALTKAIDSGDTSLVFMVVIRLVTHRGGKAAVDRIAREPEAKSMLLMYCRACESQRHLLQHYYEHDPSHQLYLSLLEHTTDHERLKEMVTSASSARFDGWETYHNVKVSTMDNACALVKNADAGMKALETAFVRQRDLLDMQAELARQCGDSEFLSASVAQTIRLCWRHGKGKDAEKFKKLFQVSDKMFWWAKLQGLVDSREWDAIDRFGGAGRYRGTVKSSPIGWVPFVSELIRGDAVERAIEYISRVPEISERLELYIECGAWRKAAEDCIRSGEEGNLGVLMQRARGNHAAQAAIELAQKDMSTRQETGLFNKIFK